MPEIPLPFRSATELGKMIRAKKISSVELTTLFLERLEKQGHALNAVAHTTRELALAQAKQADSELATGKARSPLHGVPYGAKDLLATKGIPTQWGSPAHKDQIFDYDATVVSRLREAGAVLIGKLAMVELAGGGGYEHASASLHGAAKCPWDTERWAGGSSSGSGISSTLSSNASNARGSTSSERCRSIGPLQASSGWRSTSHNCRSEYVSTKCRSSCTWKPCRPGSSPDSPARAAARSACRLRPRCPRRWSPRRSTCPRHCRPHW